MKYLLVLALTLLATSASAANRCVLKDQMYEVLAVRFGEARVTRALAADGSAVIETWANTRTGTWTLIAIRPDGLACLIVSGEAFLLVPPGDPA